MDAEKLFNVLGMIVTLAMATTLVSSPRTASIINALGRAFTGSLRAAMGSAAGPAS